MKHFKVATVLMACGHVADSITDDGEVYCSYCFGGDIRALTPKQVINHDGTPRQAVCVDCGKAASSNPSRQAFYYAYPNDDHDQYACTCKTL